MISLINKNINYDLYMKGAFGNKLKSWNNIDDFLKDSYKGSISVRYKGFPGQFCYYNIYDINPVIDEIIKNGGKKENIIINESAPDEFLTIQGEITRNENGLYIFYSTLKGKMRDCMKYAISSEGLKVKLMLEYYLTPSSYDDVMELLDLYPLHVIEFSTYSICLGDCVGRNTLIWEVRKY